MTSCWKVLQEKKDSLSSRFYDFAATKEVIQANHFKNDNRLNDLVENPNRTYIKALQVFSPKQFSPLQKFTASTK